MLNKYHVIYSHSFKYILSGTLIYKTAAGD